MNVDLKSYEFAVEYGKYPGGRLRKDGPFSGEAFREDVLVPLLERYGSVRLDLSGTKGFGSSFLDECFGEIARRYGLRDASERLEIVCTDDPLLPDLIAEKMEKAVRAR